MGGVDLPLWIDRSKQTDWGLKLLVEPVVNAALSFDKKLVQWKEKVWRSGLT